MSSSHMLALGLNLAAGMLLLAMALAGWRMLWGPRAQDRVLGLDTLYLNGMLLIVVLDLREASGFALEAALIIGLLGFAATSALAKFLMRGEVIR